MPRRTNAQIAADAERDRIAAEAEAVQPAEPSPDDEAKAAEQIDEDPNVIKRQNDMAWWCPLCGHSQTTLIGTCGGCGAVREGDRVSR